MKGKSLFILLIVLGAISGSILIFRNIGDISLYLFPSSPYQAGNLGDSILSFAMINFGKAGFISVRLIFSVLIASLMLKKNPLITSMFSWFLFFTVAAILTYLLPIDGGIFFFLFLSLSIFLKRIDSLALYPLLFLWPFFDRSFWIGSILLIALFSEKVNRKWFIFMIPFLNPVAIAGILDLEIFKPFILILLRHPAYSFPPIVSPYFLIPAIISIIIFHKEGFSASLVLSVVFSMISAAFSALPILLFGNRMQSNLSGKKVTLLILVFISGFILSYKKIPSTSDPAISFLQTINPGGLWITCDPKYHGELFYNLKSVHLLPQNSVHDLFSFWKENKRRLSTQYLNRNPDGNMIIIKPIYPEVRFQMGRNKKWILIYADDENIIYIKDKKIKGKIAKYVYNNYDPFLPLPNEKDAIVNAVSDLKRLLSVSGIFFYGYRDLGRLELDLDNLNDAIEHFLIASKIKPKNAALWNDLGVAYQKNGELQKAEKSYLRSIRLDAGETLPRMNLASLYIFGGKLEKAEALLMSVIKISPSYWMAVRRLTDVQYRLGKNSDAAETLSIIPGTLRTDDEKKFITRNQR